MHINNAITSTDRLRGALLGMFIGDALAMPVHWYYNTQALVKDYGKVTEYLRPRNPHPDSILWRSSFTPHLERQIYSTIRPNTGAKEISITTNSFEPGKTPSILSWQENF